MADFLVLLLASAISLVLLLVVVFKAIRAWKTRPVELSYGRIELLPVNTSVPASSIHLGSSVDLVSSKFAEILESENE
jgi:hypothetical protein